MAKHESLLEYSSRIAIDERTLLTSLLESSDEFFAFYSGERGQINSHIFWIWNESLEPINRLMEGELARANWIDEKNVVIIFRNYPLHTSDASIIAHELAHIVIKERGFPLVKIDPVFRGSPDFDLQVYTLNCMLHDPLVIQLLLHYGFRLTEEYENESRVGLNLVTQFGEDPRGTLLNNQILVFVQHHLQNQIFFPDAENDSVSRELQRQVEARLPIVAVEGKAIIDFIDRQGGYDTPEKVRSIYKEVIQNKLGLESIMLYE